MEERGVAGKLVEANAILRVEEKGVNAGVVEIEPTIVADMVQFFRIQIQTHALSFSFSLSLTVTIGFLIQESASHVHVLMFL